MNYQVAIVVRKIYLSICKAGHRLSVASTMEVFHKVVNVPFRSSSLFLYFSPCKVHQGLNVTIQYNLYQLYPGQIGYAEASYPYAKVL